MKKHPAVPAVHKFLKSISEKDHVKFAHSFGNHQGKSFFANLPGAVRVESAEKLIAMHDSFFDSPHSSFQYGDLKNPVEEDMIYICSVEADVTLPDQSNRKVCIDMTFRLEGDQWVPRRLINTVYRNDSKFGF